jgi:hypothetical protein
MNYLQARSPSGVTNYYEMNGVLIGESGPNGTMYYHTDALGSVTMTTNQSGAVLNEYRYKPYGAQLSKTGTAPDPKFSWVGTQGYRQTGLMHSDAYVRNRHYGTSEGRWTGVSVFDGRLGMSPYAIRPTSVTSRANSGLVNPEAITVLPILGAANPYIPLYGCGKQLLWTEGYVPPQGAILEGDQAIVQALVIDSAVIDCTTGKVLTQCHHKGLEAFTYDDGVPYGVVNSPVTPDTWSLRPAAPPCTTGYFIVSAQIGFYTPFSIKDPTYGQFKQGMPCGGDAYSYWSEGIPGSFPQGPVSRVFESWWTCCPGGGSGVTAGQFSGPFALKNVTMWQTATVPGCPTTKVSAA